MTEAVDPVVGARRAHDAALAALYANGRSYDLDLGKVACDAFIELERLCYAAGWNPVHPHPMFMRLTPTEFALRHEIASLQSRLSSAEAVRDELRVALAAAAVAVDLLLAYDDDEQESDVQMMLDYAGAVEAARAFRAALTAIKHPPEPGAPA